jgi:hypothetical protein
MSSSGGIATFEVAALLSCIDMVLSGKTNISSGRETSSSRSSGRDMGLICEAVLKVNYF